MKKHILITLCILFSFSYVYPRYKYKDIGLDGFIYTLYEFEDEYSEIPVEPFRGAEIKGLTDQKYAEARELLTLSCPSFVEYNGNEYVVVLTPDLFESRDFQFLETIIVPQRSLAGINDLPNLKRIIGATDVGGCFETMSDLPALEELELSTHDHDGDGTFLYDYSRVRNSFLNLGIKRLRYTKDSGLGLVEDSFNHLPDLEELTLCYMFDCHGCCFYNLPKLRSITFEQTPRDAHGSFIDLPMLEKIIIKKWNDHNTVGISNAFRNCPNFKDVYVEEATPCLASFGNDTDYFYPPRMTLHVPVGSRELYANANGWKCFGEIVEYDPAGVDSTEADMPGQTWSCTPTTGGLTVSADSDVAVEVLTPGGATVRRLAISAGEMSSVELPAGVYIVAANGQSEKVCVR